MILHESFHQASFCPSHDVFCHYTVNTFKSLDSSLAMPPNSCEYNFLFLLSFNMDISWPMLKDLIQTQEHFPFIVFFFFFSISEVNVSVPTSLKMHQERKYEWSTVSWTRCPGMLALTPSPSVTLDKTVKTADVQSSYLTMVGKRIRSLSILIYYGSMKEHISSFFFNPFFGFTFYKFFYIFVLGTYFLIFLLCVANRF